MAYSFYFSSVKISIMAQEYSRTENCSLGIRCHLSYNHGLWKQYIVNIFFCSNICFLVRLGCHDHDWTLVNPFGECKKTKKRKCKDTLQTYNRETMLKNWDKRPVSQYSLHWGEEFIIYYLRLSIAGIQWKLHCIFPYHQHTKQKQFLIKDLSSFFSGWKWPVPAWAVGLLFVGRRFRLTWGSHVISAEDTSPI